MSGVIHGTSHKALHLMRDPAPTLAIYWNYVARANSDNVAWPSLKRLAEDTGWGTTAIAEARQWLIDHKALEPVKDYIRPLWRDLKPQPLTRKRNFDRALYFRPTGYIVVGGKQYDLLYVARNQEADRPDKPQTESDDPSDTTFDVTSENDGRQSSRDVTLDVAELDSNSKALDIKENNLADPPIGAQQGESSTDQKPIKEPESTKPVTPEDFKPIQELVITHWFGGDWANAGWAGKIANLFLGRADQEHWIEFNFTPPYSLAEFTAFCTWLKGLGFKLPTAPEKLRRYGMQYRNEHKPKSASTDTALTADEMAALRREQFTMPDVLKGAMQS